MVSIIIRFFERFHAAHDGHGPVLYKSSATTVLNKEKHRSSVLRSGQALLICIERGVTQCHREGACEKNVVGGEVGLAFACGDYG